MGVWRRARAAVERALCATFAGVGRPVILRSSFAEIVAQGCTGAELLELRRTADGDLPRVARLVCALLRCVPRPTRVKVLCYGSKASPDTVKSVFCLPDGVEAAGIWSPIARVIAARFARGLSMRRVLVHESAHALIDHFAGGFPYPFAIQEGYATLIENTVLGEKTAPAFRSPGASTTDARQQDRRITVEALLRFDWPHEVSDVQLEYDSFFQQAVCFMGFLSELGGGRGRLVKEMLCALRREKADTWEKVYCWLLRSAQLSAAELEARFHAYVGMGRQQS